MTCPGCGNPLALGRRQVCFSDDRCYRYFLEAHSQLATGGRDKGTCLFIMLNPSTADECLSDKTIDRCKEFANKWRYGTLWVCNLYAFRSPSPSTLRKALDDGVDINGHPANNRHIARTAERADKIVLAWGGIGIQSLGKRNFSKRVSEIIPLLRDAGALEKLYALCPPETPCLPSGQPRHPKPQNLNQMPVDATECKRVRFSPGGTLEIAD